MMRSDIPFEDIFHHTSNGVIVTNADGFIVHINRQAERILECPADSSAGMFISDFLPLTGPQIMECLQTGQAKIGHPIIEKKADLVVNITLIQKNGCIQGAICNFQEMAVFESSARRLRSYKRLIRQLETIFEASSDGIWVCDGQGKVININAASARLNGIDLMEVKGKNVSDLVAGGVFDRSVTLEVIKTQRQVSVMQHVQRTGRHLLATGTPVFDEDGKIFLVVVNERDMTQLNAVREELERTQMISEKIKDELTELNLLELHGQRIVAESTEIQQVVRVALKLASLEVSNILITGESGTGKGLLAKYIHRNSVRSQKQFIQINCAALPDNLLEAELFGYEKGAFTGARERGKAGLFELAHGGTLFLDEIGDMPLPLQAKLLKYLDDNEIRRLGGVQSRKVDCTIIAATNRNLEDLTLKQRFRHDLYYRLNTFTLRIPPLRERPEDIFELVNHFLEKYNDTYGLKKQIFPEALELLQAYPFPGNVRELKNILKKAVVMSEADVLDEFIQRSLLAVTRIHAKKEYGVHPKARLSDALGALEKRMLKNALGKCKNTRQIADALGISQPTVVRKLKKHGLTRT